MQEKYHWPVLFSERDKLLLRRKLSNLCKVRNTISPQMLKLLLFCLFLLVPKLAVIQVSLICIEFSVLLFKLKTILLQQEKIPSCKVLGYFSRPTRTFLIYLNTNAL